LSAKEDVGVLEPTEADAPFSEVEELQVLVTEGRERGYLTYEEIAACLEEVEVTKEQVQELHAHLVEHGVEIVQDGKPVTPE
jgi:RNA polymerase primary sigma factor